MFHVLAVRRARDLIEAGGKFTDGVGRGSAHHRLSMRRDDDRRLQRGECFN
ncbi:MAG: hypothetical protein JF610_14950 [Acidobacteria bacterium]|nr:hypothetical protein [Acidobacteriota bacterium]